jgi:hypothetical protein
MKNYILRGVLGLLISTFPFYCPAEENTSKNLAKLGKEEEKARMNMLENPSLENIAKHKEITRESLNAAEKFAEEYCKDQKKGNN